MDLKLFGRLGRILFQVCIRATTIPYYLLYDRNTRTPILAIAQAVDDAQAGVLLTEWFATKSREAQYVQVAVWLLTTIHCVICLQVLREQ